MNKLLTTIATMALAVMVIISPAYADGSNDQYGSGVDKTVNNEQPEVKHKPVDSAIGDINLNLVATVGFVMAAVLYVGYKKAEV